MPDAFGQLHRPERPLAPDPAFAVRLRARLARALAQPGVTTMPVAGSLTPYLAVAGAREALDWYAAAWGARLVGEPIVMPDGRIGHAELDVQGARLMLSEEHPEAGVQAPQAGQGAAVTLHLDVADVDRLVAAALDAGARLDRPPADYPYGRNAVVTDPFGHRWMVSGPVLVSAAQEDREHGAPQSYPAHGEVAYAWLSVPDVEVAAAFYAQVLGWSYAPGSVPTGRQVVGGRRGIPHGLNGGVEHPNLACCYAVADIHAALERVRQAGGRGGAIDDRPYGQLVDCVDDQGVDFALYQPVGGVRPAAAAAPPDDLVYVTMAVVDAERAKAFYGLVLGWEFSVGHGPQRWLVDGLSPAVGLRGGAERAQMIPMYSVPDLGQAVAEVRRLGGEATPPAEEPYGLSSRCTDNQGADFWLVERRS
jgi:predicted enzyme related to lactoylglutathione lyase